MNGFETLRSLIGNAFDLLSAPGVHGIGTWFLAWVLAWSGIAKLVRPPLASLAFVHFRLTRRASVTNAIVLGFSETLLAVSIAAGVAPPMSLALAGFLFLSFAFLIARSLRSHLLFPCGCFGTGDSEISPRTLARALALGLLALLLASFAPWETGPVLGQDDLAQAFVGLAILGMMTLSASGASLLSWNRRYAEFLERYRRAVSAAHDPLAEAEP